MRLSARTSGGGFGKDFLPHFKILANVGPPVPKTLYGCPAGLRVNHTSPFGDLFTLDANAGGFDFTQV